MINPHAGDLEAYRKARDDRLSMKTTPAMIAEGQAALNVQKRLAQSIQEKMAETTQHLGKAEKKVRSHRGQKVVADLIRGVENATLKITEFIVGEHANDNTRADTGTLVGTQGRREVGHA